MTDYEALGISRNVTEEEIEKAYSEKIKHADKLEKARINLAYRRILSILPPKPCPKVDEKGAVYLG